MADFKVATLCLQPTDGHPPKLKKIIQINPPNCRTVDAFPQVAGAKRPVSSRYDSTWDTDAFDLEHESPAYRAEMVS